MRWKDCVTDLRVDIMDAGLDMDWRRTAQGRGKWRNVIDYLP